MILMKEYVFQTIAAMKMGKTKDIFIVIIATVAKRKKMLHWVIPCQIIQGMSPLPHGFFEIFTSGRYHSGMKILKIHCIKYRNFT